MNKFLQNTLTIVVSGAVLLIVWDYVRLSRQYIGAPLISDTASHDLLKWQFMSETEKLELLNDSEGKSEPFHHRENRNERNHREEQREPSYSREEGREYGYRLDDATESVDKAALDY